MKRVLFLSFILLANSLGALAQQKTHVVARGETLVSIAKKYGLSEVELKAANPNLSVVFTGIKLVIPEKTNATEPEATEVNEVPTQTVEEKPTSSDGQDEYDKGEEYYQQKNYAKALEWYMKSAAKGHLSATSDIGYLYEDGLGVKQDYEKAIKWYLKSANLGNVHAMTNVGMMYYTGRGTIQNYSKAMEWFKKAAEKGDTRAMWRIGFLYKNGEGVKQNDSKAVEWFRKAAEKDYASAQVSLGLMYERGQGVTKDLAEAVKWYRNAAELGNEDGQRNLGLCYKKGTGVQQDYVQAYKWISKAAKQDYADAQVNLGLMYEHGEGVTKDYAEAVKWYRKAAEQGNADGQANLGLMYDNGTGVAQDYNKAAEWYQKAADQNDATALCNLGLLYANGKGVEKDYLKAAKLYQMAMDQGEMMACNNLAVLYENGNGLKKNPEKAVELYRKAAVAGNALAPCNLGYMYEIGSGVTKDYNAALNWYEKAAEQGHERAKANMASLKEAMTKGASAVGAETEERHENQKPMLPNEGIEKVDSDIPTVNRINRTTFAVIIANEDYQDEVKVDYARNDGEVFRKYCNMTLGLPEKNIHFVANATYAKLIGELDWLRQVCDAYKGEVSVIFYYAGHGIPDEMSGSSYILPIDGSSRIIRTCLSVSELYNMLGSLPTKKVTVLMDACFSGAKRNGGMMTSARGVAIKAKSATPRGNMVILSAAQGDETAYKFEDAKHGLFTYFLLKKLKTTKGKVTLGELCSYIQNEVRRYSIVENGKSQTPTLQVSDKLGTSWQSMEF